MSGSSPELTIAVATSADGAAWNEYLATHPEAAWDHRFEWRRIVARAYGKEACYLYAHRAGRWCGVLPLVRMRGPLTGNQLVSMPYLDQGGVLADSAEIAEAMWVAALERAHSDGFAALHVRGSGDFVTRRALTPASRFRMLIELAGDTEAQWSAVGPKVRNQVRKSERQGLETRRAAAEDLDRFYGVWSRNMRDLGSPPHSKRFFREVFDGFGERIRLYLTFKDGLAVAGAVYVHVGAVAVVPWASALREVRADCPNHSLYWKILTEAIADGVVVFDFGRSTIDTGTYRFKKQWRATPVAVAWQTFDTAGEPRESGGPSAGSRWVDLWRRLPVGVSNRLGPLVRRQVSN